jgi:hypothetical protein
MTATSPLTWSNGRTTKGLNSKHLELMEVMLREPTLSSAEHAALIGMTESWVSTIKHSDLFIEEYNRRVGEHRLKVSEDIIRKTEEVANKVLTRMNKVLDNEEEEIGIGRLAQVFDITSKRLFPAERGGGTIVNIALADPDAIRKARERAERLRTGPLMLDATIEPASS